MYNYSVHQIYTHTHTNIYIYIYSHPIILLYVFVNSHNTQYLQNEINNTNKYFNLKHEDVCEYVSAKQAVAQYN